MGYVVMAAPSDFQFGAVTLVVVRIDDGVRTHTSGAEVAAAIASNAAVTPAGVVRVQVTPPLVVTSIVSAGPTAQPWWASLKATDVTGEPPAGSARRVQVAPPLVLTAILLPVPATATPALPKVAMAWPAPDAGANGSATFCQPEPEVAATAARSAGAVSATPAPAASARAGGAGRAHSANAPASASTVLMAALIMVRGRTLIMAAAVAGRPISPARA